MKKVCIIPTIVLIGLIFVPATIAFIPEVDDEVLALIMDIRAIDIDDEEVGVKLEIEGLAKEVKIEYEQLEIKLEIDDGQVKKVKIENEQIEIKIEIDRQVKVKIEVEDEEIDLLMDKGDIIASLDNWAATITLPPDYDDLKQYLTLDTLLGSIDDVVSSF